MNARGLSVVLAGGPESGKTTYLGALWSSVHDADEDAPVHLRGSLPDHTQYLDAAEHALLACERVERTRRGTAEHVTLALSVDGHPMDLDYLDLAGETLESGLEMRMIAPELAHHFAQADCLLLFVHPNIVTGQTIAETNRQLRAALGGDAVSADPAVEDNPVDLADVDPVTVWGSAPTSVHLVDLLQIAERFRDGASCRIAVVVSAWDAVADGDKVTPRQWVARQLPLLDQFLRANQASNPWNVYGISAQGGDFDNEADVERLLGIEYPQRGVVVSDDGTGADLAAPLRWFAKAHP